MNKESIDELIKRQEAAFKAGRQKVLDEIKFKEVVTTLLSKLIPSFEKWYGEDGIDPGYPLKLKVSLEVEFDSEKGRAIYIHKKHDFQSESK